MIKPEYFFHYQQIIRQIYQSSNQICYTNIFENMKKPSNNSKPNIQVFNVDNYLSTGIPRSQILQLKDAFDLIDSNSTGKLDPAQLRNMFKLFGMDFKNQSLQIAVNQATYNNKAVDFSSFLQIFTANFYAPKNKENFSKLFRLFDDENTGCITGKNLRRVIKQLDLQIDENEIQQMIQRADINDDGVVTEQQFYQIMTRISPKVYSNS